MLVVGNVSGGVGNVSCGVGIVMAWRCIGVGDCGCQKTCWH